MQRAFIFYLFLIFSIQGVCQQRIGFTLPEGTKKTTVKFEVFNNLIVVPVTINGFLSTKFILDTGAEAAILTEKILGDMVGLKYVRDIKVSGPGLIDSIEAKVATNVTISLPGGVVGQRMSMLVLKDDYLELKRNLGDDIYGIIGFDIFNRFVVEIDYDNLELTLHDPKKFKAKKRWPSIDLTLQNSKPFIATIFRQDNHQDTIKLMVDTGASHAVLLDVHNTDDLDIPSQTIKARLGQGLGGEIPGLVGRLNYYKIGKFDFDNILVSIPNDGVYSNAIKRGSRHGTVGGEILTRLNPIFDYEKGKIYLFKGKIFKKNFEFDMSGITLNLHEIYDDTLVIEKVKVDSPAEKVGLLVGDRVIRINGKDINNAKLYQINAILRKRDRAKIKIKIIRDGKVMKKEFYLERMI